MKNSPKGMILTLERALITEHLKDLEMNRYPQISRKLGRPIDEIQRAVKRLARLHPYPGKQIGGNDAPPITPDAIIYYDEDQDTYEIEMTNDPAPNLYISGMYRKMLKDRTQDKKTREFLSNNVRNARWLIESIEQRSSTIMRVIRTVVDAQREFFDKGPGISEAPADDSRGRSTGHSRRHCFARRLRKMDSNPPRRVSAAPLLLRRHHQLRRRRHELGRGEGKAQDDHRQRRSKESAERR